MVATLRWTIDHLEALPQHLDDTRYEIIGGELHVTRQPSLEHQIVSLKAGRILDEWSEQTGSGTTIPAPGVIFAHDEAVAPDVVWVSRENLPRVRRPDGKLHGAPDLMIEVLSPGSANEERDRDVKLLLYSRQGVQEYWIMNWQLRQVQVYRRQEGVLVHVATLLEQDRLESPLLSGFSCQVSRFFAGID